MSRERYVVCRNDNCDGDLLAERLGSIIRILHNSQKIQAKDWDHDNYMHGMYNGLEFALSVVEDRDPIYKDVKIETSVKH